MSKLTLTKLAGVAAMIVASTPASAGRGGSNELIEAAVKSGSVDSIIAEVEKSEGLLCDDCIPTVTALLADNRFAVREVAAWWIAKRPGLMNQLANRFVTAFGADSITVRNAADYLGRIRYYKALPILQIALTRTDLTPEAKLAMVGAVGYMAHVKGDKALQIAMADASPKVRAAAVLAYRDVLDQKDVSPVAPSLDDGDAQVRANAAEVVGAYAYHGATQTLIKLLGNDPDSSVRRNAAWALGKIGDAAARPALALAINDKSALVRGVAKASLATLDAPSGGTPTQSQANSTK
jgi:HEAT repeat protein